MSVGVPVGVSVGVFVFVCGGWGQSLNGLDLKSLD